MRIFSFARSVKLKTVRFQKKMRRSCCVESHFNLFILISLLVIACAQVPESSTNWLELISTDGVRFGPRNGKKSMVPAFCFFLQFPLFVGHATCVFKGYLWVTGGRTDSYADYNLQANDKMADVWRSVDGSIWKQITNIQGDYFAQNIDVVQPGPIAPW
jgi:hypothetical protein